MIDLNQAGQQREPMVRAQPPMQPRGSAGTLDAILQALGGQRTKENEISTHCPAHEDRTPSLSVTDQGGKLLVKCFAGCEQSAVIEALKARTLWPTSGNGSDGNGIPQALKGKPRTGLWEYRDQNGSLLGYVARFDGGIAKSGKAEKDFLPFFKRDGGKWKAGAAPVPRPLYGLHKLPGHNGLVIVCEGEKSADAAQILAPDCACLTWPGGSGAAKKADWSLMMGRNVVIWPDADEPGLKAVRDVASACRKAGAASVRTMTIPAGKNDGWDAADALAEGWDISEAEFGEGPAGDVDLIQGGIFSAAELLEMDLPEIVWAIEGLLPMGLAILAGPPKMGKSWLIYAISLAIGRGGLVLGHFHAQPARVLYLALEDSKKRLQGRLRSLIQLEPELRDGLVQVDIQLDWPRVDEGGLEELEKYIQTNLARGLKLVVIDTLAKIGPKSKPKGMNAYEADSLILGRVKSLADRYGICILVVTHLTKLRPSKDPFEAITGSMGQLGTADTALLLVRTRGSETAKFMTTGRDIDGETYGLRWINPGWTCTGVAEDSEDLSPERQAVLQAFKDSADPMSPAMVAHALKKNPKNISKLIKNLVDDGFLISVGYGLYGLVGGGSGGSDSSGRSGRSGS